MISPVTPPLPGFFPLWSFLGKDPLLLNGKQIKTTQTKTKQAKLKNELSSAPSLPE